MAHEVAKIEYTAQVTTSIEFVPNTLFFTLPRRAWLSGELRLSGVRIGASDSYDFTEEEIKQIQNIVWAATARHIKSLKEYGNA